MRRLAAFLACASALAGTTSAPAATFGLAVGATVLSASNCMFRTAAGSVLAFGNIDPSSATNRTATVNLTIRCAGSAATASYALTANDGLYGIGPGQPRMRHAVTPTEYLPFALNTPISGITPKNVDTVVGIIGTITPAQFQNAPVGNYADTVVLTLSP